MIQLLRNQNLNFTHLAIDIQTLFILNFVIIVITALNSDLFRCNIIDSPLCSFFFFKCTQYSALKTDIFNEIFCIENLIYIVNTHVLLWGVCSIGIAENKHLFSLVHQYIKSSNRFNYDNGESFFCIYVNCYIGDHYLYYAWPFIQTVLILLMTFHFYISCLLLIFLYKLFV